MKKIEGDGFAVQLEGRAGFFYCEPDRTMRIDGEMLVGATDLVVYTSSIGIWKETGEVVDAQEKARIVANLRTLFAGAGMNVDFE